MAGDDYDDDDYDDGLIGSMRKPIKPHRKKMKPIQKVMTKALL